MNERYLSRLFRNSQPTQREDAALPDAASLAALVGDGPVSTAERTAARIAESGRNADLYRFARELQPISAQLSHDLRAQFAATELAAVHHRRRGLREQHRHQRARTWRWAAATAAAASLALVVGLWTTQHSSGAHHAAGLTMARTGVNRVPDRIFAAFNDKVLASSQAGHGDEIFRSNFRSEAARSTKANEG